MKKTISIFLTALLCCAMAFSVTFTASAKFNQEAKPKVGDTVAVLHTNYGDIAMSFFPKYAPKGVENFQTLAKEKKYNNSIFHRVIKKFMIQGGDYTNGDGTGGESCWGKEFENECVDELKNIRGAVAYANSGPDTNGSQFFINLVKNAHLDGNYTVFGQVFAGMDVVDLISNCEVTVNSGGESSSPINDVKLESVEITKYTKNMENSLKSATDPYEGVKSTTTATEATEATETTTVASTDSTTANNEDSDEPFNFIPIIVTVGVLAIIFACFAIPYGIQDKKKKKAKAEAKAAMKADPDYKKKKSKKKDRGHSSHDSHESHSSNRRDNSKSDNRKAEKSSKRSDKSKSHSEKKKHTGLKTFIVIIIILGALCGGVYAYFGHIPTKEDIQSLLPVSDSAEPTSSNSIHETLVAITVSGDTVTYNGEVLSSVDELNNRLSKETDPTISLINNDANASTYNKVVEIVNNYGGNFETMDEDNTNPSINTEENSTEENTTESVAESTTEPTSESTSSAE